MNQAAGTTRGGWGGKAVRIVYWGGVAAVIAAPAIAMRFTDEVDWSPGDFIFAGGMLTIVGVVFEIAMRTTRKIAYRAGAALALLGALMLIWVNGAVGIIGSENNPANQIFLGVLAVALVGSVVGRFSAVGMKWAMYAAAVAQAVCGVVALVAGWGNIFPITLFFAAFWLIAAGLFDKAARDGVSA